MKARLERSVQQPEQVTRRAAPQRTVLALQRTAGNAAVTRLLQPRVLLGGRRDQLNEVRRPIASRDYPAETTR